MGSSRLRAAATHLVVGGAGMAGQATIAALRARDPDCEIIATTTAMVADSPIPGASSVIAGIDFAQYDALPTLVAGLSAPVATLVYTPAFGPVGFPAARATEAQIAAAAVVSVTPLVALRETLAPSLTIGFSAFYWLDAVLPAYGAMAHAKRALDAVALAEPAQIKLVRAGVIPSRSAKAIALSVYREIRRGEHQQLATRYRASGQGFFDFFYGLAYADEAACFAPRFGTPHRPTEPADVTGAVAALLAGADAPFVNVIGDWLWHDDRLPTLPAYLDAPSVVFNTHTHE